MISVEVFFSRDLCKSIELRGEGALGSSSKTIDADFAHSRNNAGPVKREKPPSLSRRNSLKWALKSIFDCAVSQSSCGAVGEEDQHNTIL